MRSQNFQRFIHQDADISRLFEEIIQEYEAQDIGFEMIIKSLFLKVTGLIFRKYFRYDNSMLCYQVQLGAYSELEILAGMREVYKRPIHLTFNSLYYIPEQYPMIEDIIRSCMELDFQSFILADPALIVYLRKHQ